MTIRLKDSPADGDCDLSANGQISDPQALVIHEILPAPVFLPGTMLAVISPLPALGCYMIISMKRKATITN